MALARLVVIEGPDLGTEFDVPLRGGGIGRGEDNLVQLSDLAVSRQHCRLELREGAIVVVDDSGRPRTLVNGRPVEVHRLAAGDEIAIGKTRLAFVAGDSGALTRQAGKVTMEVGSRELMAMVTGAPGEQRARRLLAALAALGDRLRAEIAAGREATARAACEASLGALGADAALLMLGGAVLAMVGAAERLPAEVAAKVLTEGKAIAVGTATGAAIAVPLAGDAEAWAGLLWIERRSEAAFDSLDVMAAGCLAHLVAAALASAADREQLARSKAALEERVGDGDFVGRSTPARRLLDFVARVGPSDATVLLTGESGSGKEMVARAIHRASRRREGPCVAVNCAALTETLIESELFGHDRGAFTGATEKKLGRFEMADRGTLFLDEVGEMPLGLQTKFLRVLEERRFERVGGSRTIEVDVRVVAATNRDLGEMVTRGAFREDLFYRLSVIHAVVPPLRERPDDVVLLAEHFLARFRVQAGRRIRGFSPEALRALAAHPWPGNVRELRNAIERAVVLGDSDWIRGEDLPPPVAARAGARRPASPTPPLGSMALAVPDTPQRAVPDTPPRAVPDTPPRAVPDTRMVPDTPQRAVPDTRMVPDTPQRAVPDTGGPKSLRELERDGIVAALAATGGNKAQAAAILAIDRSTLYKKLKEYGIG
jgi:transcriptional regulator with GAF, ATPase, and Fis domain